MVRVCSSIGSGLIAKLSAIVHATIDEMRRVAKKGVSICELGFL